MDAAWAQVIVSGLVGFTQCGLIMVGLWQMRESSKERNRQLDRQDTVMEQQMTMLQQQGKALEQQGKALESASLGMPASRAAQAQCLAHAESVGGMHVVFLSVYQCKPGMQTRYLFVGLFTGRPAPATALECRPR